MRSPTIKAGPASQYAGPGETIREFSDGTSGGLLSLRRVPDGPLVVEVYREDGDVEVRHQAAEVRAAGTTPAPAAPSSILPTLLATDAPHGFESYLVGNPADVQAWFATARNAAAWVDTQDAARTGTLYEYRVRPAPTPRSAAISRKRASFEVPGGVVHATLTRDGNAVEVRGVAVIGTHSDGLTMRPELANLVVVALREA